MSRVFIFIAGAVVSRLGTALLCNKEALYHELQQRINHFNANSIPDDGAALEVI